MQTLGDRIKSRRKDMKYTQRSLAQVVGVSHVTISQWESGDSTPGGKNLFTLAEALRCTPTWILFGDKDQTPEQAEKPNPPLSEIEKELLKLFNSLPESEKEQHMTNLRFKVEGLNKLFHELLEARKNNKI